VIVDGERRGRRETEREKRLKIVIEGDFGEVESDDGNEEAYKGLGADGLLLRSDNLDIVLQTCVESKQCEDGQKYAH
jgi:hypothetical protein